MGNDPSVDGGPRGLSGPMSTKPSSYSELQLKFPLTKEQAQAVMKEFSRQKSLRPDIVSAILTEGRNLVHRQSPLLDLKCPTGGHLTVVGDIHGQYFDMIRIFRMGGWPSEKNAYVFDGDFVDRGPHGTEVVLTLLIWKLVYPEHVHMLRGNHEVPSVNEYYGFRDELTYKYRMEGDRLRDQFNSFFTVLPLGAIIANRILVVHGGIPRAIAQSDFSLQTLRNCTRQAEPELKTLLSDVLWSDPHDDLGQAESERNAGILFGPDITQRFLLRTGLDCIIRAHQVCHEGYRVQHHGRVITVFSAPNYCGRCDNLAAVAKFDDQYAMRIFQFKENASRTTIMEPANAMAMHSVIGRYHALTVGTDVENFHGHSDKGASAVRWCPNGELLVSGGDDGSVRIWDTSGVERAALQLDKRPYSTIPEVKAVEWLGSSDTIAIGSSDGKLRLWNVQAALANTVLQEELKAKIAEKTKAFDEFAHALLEQCNQADAAMQKSLDKQFVDRKSEFEKEKDALETQKHQVERSSKLPPTVITMTAHWERDPSSKEAVVALAWSKHHSLLASASRDHTVRLWNVEAAAEEDEEDGCVAVLEGHQDWLWGVKWSGDDDSVVMSCSEDGSVRFWDVALSLAAEAKMQPMRAERESHKAASNDEGVMNATAAIEAEPRSAREPLLIRDVQGSPTGVTALALCEGTSWFATGLQDSRVMVWDGKPDPPELIWSSERIQNVSRHQDTITGLAWLNDHVLVSGSQDKTLRVWNVAKAVDLDLQYSAILSFLTRPELNLKEMAEEKQNYMTSIDDMEAQMCVAKLNGLEKQVVDVACSPDGAHIAAASLDKNSPISLWISDEILRFVD